MYQRKVPKDIRCPVERGMDILGGKWNGRVVCVLSKRERLRYNELRSELVNVTDAALSSALRSLTENGIVERTQFEEIPPRVEYSLTEKGRDLLPVFYAILQWGMKYIS